jgi:hypothetical protein
MAITNKICSGYDPIRQALLCVPSAENEKSGRDMIYMKISLNTHHIQTVNLVKYPNKKPSGACSGHHSTEGQNSLQY